MKNIYNRTCRSLCCWNDYRCIYLCFKISNAVQEILSEIAKIMNVWIVHFTIKRSSIVCHIVRAQHKAVSSIASLFCLQMCELKINIILCQVVIELVW